MRRSTFEGATRVYQYGCRGEPVLDEAAIGQLRLANQLWNALVEIDQAHQGAVDAAWQAQPEVAVATELLEAADAALAAALEAAAEERKQARSRHPRSSRAAELAGLRAQRKVARLAQREAKAAAYDALAPLFHDLTAARRAAVKATYATYVQASGLYWPTYNAVIQAHDTAAAAVASRRKAGAAAELHFRRFEGNGTWTVQLQRAAADPERTFAGLLAGDTKWRQVARIDVEPVLADPSAWEALSPAQRRRAGRGQLAIRIGSRPDRSAIWLELPVTFHRPIPADADITQIQVTRRRIGTHFELSASFTCRLAAPAPISSVHGVVALDIGWRRLSDGALRVAVWQSPVTRTLQLPEPARRWVRPMAGGGELILPAPWLAEQTAMEKIQALRDLKLDALRPLVVEWLAEHPDATEALDIRGEVSRWRSPARFAALALRWRDNRQSGDPTVLAALSAWRVQDRHLYERVANTRDQLGRRRREVYRCVAAALVDTYGVIALETMHIGQITRPGPAEDPSDEQADAARRQARAASPGMLTGAIRTAAQREGVVVVEVPAKDTTRIHQPCGTRLEASAAERITMWCPVCECGFDQDQNAAANLLASAEVSSACDQAI